MTERATLDLAADVLVTLADWDGGNMELTEQTYGEFVDQNSDLFDSWGEDVGFDIDEALPRGEVYRAGGGSQPRWSIRLDTPRARAAVACEIERAMWGKS